MRRRLLLALTLALTPHPTTAATVASAGDASITHDAQAGTRLSNLNGFQFIVPAGTVHWLTGLQGDNADVEHNEAFTLQGRDLAVGERLELGAVGRSSETSVPWLAIDGEQDQFYAALMW